MLSDCDAAYLDGVHRADRYAGNGHTREHMPANLKYTHWKSIFEDGPRRFPQPRETDSRTHKQQAVPRHKAKLNKRQGHRILELVKNSLAGVGRHCGGRVPQGTHQAKLEHRGRIV